MDSLVAFVDMDTHYSHILEVDKDNLVVAFVDMDSLDLVVDIVDILVVHIVIV